MAVIALATALTSLGHWIYDQATAPSATVSNAATSSIVQNGKCETSFTADISASNIGADQSIWVIAQADNGFLYPIDRFDTAVPGPWHASARLTTTQPIAYYVVIMLSSSNSGSLLRYLRHRSDTPNHVDQEIAILPVGYRYLTSWGRGTDSAGLRWGPMACS